MNDLLIRVLKGLPVPRTPIWVMRQAGRYLPQYQAVRKNHNFLEMIYTPELAAEITIQPIDALGFDAAIIFSDILVVPQAMGMKLSFIEHKGPVFHTPLRDFRQLDRLAQTSATETLQPLMKAIRLVRQELAGRVPLIGFAGSPWTLAAYMIEGSGSKTFRYAKTAVHAQPEQLHRLLQRLTREIVSFLKQQIAAGVQVVQIFDSWAGQLSPEHFRQFSLPYLRTIIEELAAEDVPVILFARGAAHSLEHLAATGAHALGIDWQTDLTDARKQIDGRAAFQGNLDPTALYAPVPQLKQHVRQVLQKAGPAPRHIFNLGHGILPDTPVDHVRALVELIHKLSPGYYPKPAAAQRSAQPMVLES